MVKVKVDSTSAISDDKLMELILYIASRCEDDERFGATKLNKILFYSDFLAYALRGEPITNQPYRRLPWGPAPKFMRQVCDKMKQRGILAIQHLRYYDRMQDRPIALRDPDLTDFDGEEIAIVNKIIDDLWNKNASEASALSHKFKGWEVVDDMEEIPYEMVFVNSRPPTREEWEFGKVVAAEAFGGES